MNKIICDVCGTMYPENASQCPICGCAKPADAAVTPEEGTSAENAAGAYVYTKGGRFSKNNVRKRNKNAVKTAKTAKAAAPAAAPKKSQEVNSDAEQNPENSNKGLIIAIVLLIVAIVGMLCYIFFTYFAGDLFAAETTPTTTAPTTTQASVTTNNEIKCQDLDLQVPNNEITLDKPDHAWLLNVVASPADTTDTITYTTSDPSVVLVSEDGRVTAVANGTATITVTCGDVVKQCQVVCNIATEPTTEETTEATTEETTEETTEATTKPTEEKPDLSKFHTDVLGSKYDNDCRLGVGESCTIVLRDGDGNKVDVTWSATVEGYFTIDGYKITGVKATPSDPNEADKIRATCTYEGEEFSCIIRVRPEKVVIEPTEPTEYTGPTIDDPGYEISHTDVTISGGEKFTLTLTDSNGQPVNATWQADKPDVVSVNGNVITGMKKGKAVVSFRVANHVYECIVRVSSSASDGAVG